MLNLERGGLRECPKLLLAVLIAFLLLQNRDAFLSGVGFLPLFLSGSYRPPLLSVQISLTFRTDFPYLQYFQYLGHAAAMPSNVRLRIGQPRCFDRFDLGQIDSSTTDFPYLQYFQYLGHATAMPCNGAIQPACVSSSQMCLELLLSRVNFANSLKLGPRLPSVVELKDDHLSSRRVDQLVMWAA